MQVKTVNNEIDPKTKELLVEIINELINDENHLTKDEFLKQFEQVIAAVVVIRNQNEKEVDILKQTYDQVIETIQVKQNISIDEMKGMIHSMLEAAKQTVESMTTNCNDMMSSMTDKLREADERMAAEKEPVPIPELSLSPDEIRNSLELLNGDERLDKTAIKGLEVYEELLKTPKDDGGNRLIYRGGTVPIAIQGLGVTIDKNVRAINFKGSGLTSVVRRADGVVEVTITGAPSAGTVVSEETPTDSGDHLNFTLAHTPIDGTFRLYRGGARQQSIGLTPDFTRVTTAVTLTTALATGEVLFADYNY